MFNNSMRQLKRALTIPTFITFVFFSVVLNAVFLILSSQNFNSYVTNAISSNIRNFNLHVSLIETMNKSLEEDDRILSFLDGNSSLDGTIRQTLNGKVLQSNFLLGITVYSVDDNRSVSSLNMSGVVEVNELKTLPAVETFLKSSSKSTIFLRDTIISTSYNSFLFDASFGICSLMSKFHYDDKVAMIVSDFDTNLLYNSMFTFNGYNGLEDYNILLKNDNVILKEDNNTVDFDKSNILTSSFYSTAINSQALKIRLINDVYLLFQISTNKLIIESIIIVVVIVVIFVLLSLLYLYVCNRLIKSIFVPLETIYDQIIKTLE